MTNAQQKITQYLDEARASELALIRELQAQITMTPRGSYRTLLETHLRETRLHAERLGKRLKDLGHGSNPVEFVVGTAQKAIGQAVSLGKGPLNLIRGSGGEEKVLKNAKDACATEALEIATYTAIEHLARAVGDETTARLAVSIRADEEKMLGRVQAELPKLTDAVVRAEIDGESSYDVSKTGAADAVRETAQEAKSTARTTTARAKRTTRQAPIAKYDDLTADEVVAAVRAADDKLTRKVRDYERAHKSRASVLKATERELASVS